MYRTSSGGEISLPHAAAGALAAGVITALTRAFVLKPLFGEVAAKTGSTLLLFFLCGYLVLAIAPKGQSPTPLWSWLRLRMGLIFGVVGLIVAGVERLWP